MGHTRFGWIAALVLVPALFLTGCATTGAVPDTRPVDDLGEARWVETTPAVRTLLVAPGRIGPVARPGEDAADLAIGSFFARYDSPVGPLDQLALMVVLEGETATRILDSGLSLLLEIDGEFFQGEPGLGNNSVSWNPADRGRATLAIPISPEILQALARADEVRGRIGAYAVFDFPTSKRDRLGDVLNGLPLDFRPSPSAGGARAIQALILE